MSTHISPSHQVRPRLVCIPHQHSSRLCSNTRHSNSRLHSSSSHRTTHHAKPRLHRISSQLITSLVSITTPPSAFLVGNTAQLISRRQCNATPSNSRLQRIPQHTNSRLQFIACQSSPAHHGKSCLVCNPLHLTPRLHNIATHLASTAHISAFPFSSSRQASAFQPSSSVQPNSRHSISLLVYTPIPRTSVLAFTASQSISLLVCHSNHPHCRLRSELVTGSRQLVGIAPVAKAAFSPKPFPRPQVQDGP